MFYTATKNNMHCPFCNTQETSVLESRVVEDEATLRRRRECKKCKKRFTTYEKVARIDLKVIKRSGVLEDFDRDKIVKGVKKACWKRPVEDKDIEILVDDIEIKLLNRQTTRVPSSDIGRMVLTRLKKLDDVAYLRFASVYLDINSANDLLSLIKNLQGGINVGNNVS